MLNCKEAARLMSQDMDGRLSARERLLLRLHLLMCYGCRNARQQFRFIRLACSRWIERGD